MMLVIKILLGEKKDSLQRDRNSILREINLTEQNQKQVWIILNTLSIAFPISKDSEHGEAGRRVEILNDL